MKLLETIYILIQNWNRKYNESPRFLYVGRDEYRQLLESEEFVRQQKLDLENLTCFGLEVVEVSKKSHLMVGTAIDI